jgi:hypothetical protein
VRGANLAFALALHVIVGVFGLGWALCARSYGDTESLFLVVLWVVGAGLMVAWRESHPGRLWLVPLLWALSVWAPVFGLVAVGAGVLVWMFGRPVDEGAAAPGPWVRGNPAGGDVERRIAALEQRLEGFMNELAQLKREVSARPTRAAAAEAPIPAPTLPSAPAHPIPASPGTGPGVARPSTHVEDGSSFRVTWTKLAAHSSSGLGRRPLTAVARVRIPYAPLNPC